MPYEPESGWQTFLREEQPLDEAPSDFDLGGVVDVQEPVQESKPGLSRPEKKDEPGTPLPPIPWELWKKMLEGTRGKRFLEPTWWILDREPGMDDIYDRAGDSLQPMVDKLGIYPFQDTQGKPRLFLARYEFPKDQEQFQHQDGIFLDNPQEAFGLLDFLAGFPMECIEMLGMVGEYSTKKDEIDVKSAEGPTAPVPTEFFKGLPPEKILLNTLFLEEKGQGKVLVDNLQGEPEPKNLHWWVRSNIKQGVTFPIPGEFLGLAVRMMPDMPWGAQKSSPFIYSGNWMDTIYYTSARVKAVIPPDDDFPYPRYRVQWRKDVVEATPSDFAEYQVDDRVTLLKMVDVQKTSQQWKDDDVKDFPAGSQWTIVPITFYDDLGKKEEG